MKRVNKSELASLVGSAVEPTDWLTITQERVNDFADTTNDHQFIHVDPEKAAQTPFGGTIAHGMLTLSLVAYFAQSFAIEVENTAMVVNYGFDKVRFLAPVKVGSRIRGNATLNNMIEKSEGEFLLTYNVTVEIEGKETPALIAEWLVLVVTSN